MDSDEHGRNETRPAMQQQQARRMVMHNSPEQSGSPESGEMMRAKNNSECLPISDNNVSTTNDSVMDEPEWDTNDPDINVSVTLAQ